MSADHEPEREPDHVLDQQAYSEGLIDRRPTRSGAPPHDTDAEVAVLGSMLDSLTACDTVLGEVGLTAKHYYSPFHAEIHAAIERCLAAGDKPEPFTVAPLITHHDVTAHDLLTIQLGHHQWYNADAYAKRIIDTHTARGVLGRALEVAEAARTGDIDEALRLVTKLTDELPSAETEGGWAPVDLTDVLAGTSTGPTPTVLAVEGAPALFYARRTNLIFGESGAGKTWVALAAVAEAIRAGTSVIYIDLEDTAEGLVGRLRTMGLPTQAIANHLLYLQPELPWGPTAQASLAGMIDTHGVGLVVLDSTGEAMAADGVKGNDDDDVARWFTACPKYLARRGPAVLIIDHIPKDDQNAPLSPIGSQRKKAAIDGAAYRIDAPKAPSKGHDGLLVATVSKDRHGTRHKGQKAAQVALTHDPDIDGVIVTVMAPQAPPTDAEGNFRPTRQMEAISRLLEATPGLSGRTIEKEIRGRAAVIREANRLLVTEGYIAFDAGAKVPSYVSVKPFRADDDEAPEHDEEEL